MPTLVAKFLGGRDVVLHSENGILGYGEIVEGPDFDPDLHDAGGWFVTVKPGASFFESVTSFEIARSGRLAAVVLGGYQVSERGDLANWATPEMMGGGIGGAMDLAVGARQLIVTMEHTDSKGRPKLVRECSYPLTAPERVDTVVTDLALLQRRGRALPPAGGGAGLHRRRGARPHRNAGRRRRTGRHAAGLDRRGRMSAPAPRPGSETRFADNPMLSGFGHPVRMEGDIYDLEVAQGRVPEELDGTFFRVQLDPQWPARDGNDMPFNADGMITSFRFEDGHVDFKSRYVRTPRFLAERAARKALFGAYRNPFTDDPSVAGMVRGLANTNVYWHGGRLLASKEDSPPIELDPDTLETIGQFDWDGALTSCTATAHPKIDPRTGELVFFGFAAKGEATPDIAYYEADRLGRVVHEAWFEAPYASMVHDFAVTEHFVVFPIIPLTSDLERLKAGGSHYVWDGSRDVYLGVLPRRGSAADLRWFRGANRFASHVMNAFDDGRHIYVDTPVGESSAFPFFPDLSGAPFDPRRAAAYLSRWTIDTESGTEEFKEAQLTDHPGELPRIDDRFATRASTASA